MVLNFIFPHKGTAIFLLFPFTIPPGSTGMSKSIRDTMTKPLPTVFLRSTANRGKPPLTGVICNRVLPARIPGCGSSLRGGPRSTYGGRLPTQNRKDSPPFRVKNQRSGVVVDFSTSGPFSPESK